MQDRHSPCFIQAMRLLRKSWLCCCWALCCVSCASSVACLFAADASRMNALTGSPITSDSSKSDGSGLVKQAGTILIVPQGTGDVSKGQVGLLARHSTARHSTARDMTLHAGKETTAPQLVLGLHMAPAQQC